MPDDAAHSAAAVDTTRCYHCSEANPSQNPWHAQLNGEQRWFCCAGCLAIAQTIYGAGLAEFYKQRTQYSRRFTQPEDNWSHYDHPSIQQDFVTAISSDEHEAALLLEDLRCAACVWLIEQRLNRLPGIRQCSINFSTQRARISWCPQQISLSSILSTLAKLGYRAYPYQAARFEAMARRVERDGLLRLAIAWLVMMQVMMFAVPGYLSLEGVAAEHEILLRWASLVLTVPVVFFSAWPFFSGAYRDLKQSRVGMDVPVAIGIAAAFCASVWATVTKQGEVYFDSVTMFVALLLTARYIELRIRLATQRTVERLTKALPELAEHLHDYPHSQNSTTVAVRQLRAGDIVLIKPGAMISVDGTILAGESYVEQALLTGESEPLKKTMGDAVLAGSYNQTSPLIVRCQQIGEHTVLAGIARLMDRALQARPRLALLSERIAAQFTGAILLIAAIAGLWWWIIDPLRVLPIVFAVLVVSCPCALSMATPAVFSAAMNALARRGVLLTRTQVLEILPRLTHMVFDKTGTLTLGDIRLLGIVPLATRSTEQCLQIAASLEQASEHPIAKAFIHSNLLPVQGRHNQPGQGISGTIDGQRYRIGRAEYVAELNGQTIPWQAKLLTDEVSGVALGDEHRWLAWFSLGDALRPGSKALVKKMVERKLNISLFSGDRPEVVQKLAHELAIKNARGGLDPQTKLIAIQDLQKQGAVVAMAGDGINDAPSLAQAQISLVMKSGAPLAQAKADIVLLTQNIGVIDDLLAIAGKTLRVMKQNLLWAFSYNIISIPLAVFGWLAPWQAALGMALSSLLVVLNAARLNFSK